jgi:DNA-binding transcriptional MerR regulator
MIKKRDTFRTTEIAKAVGVHPNTVRMYELWGFLPSVKRSSNGYRMYSLFHLEQMRLARLAMHGGWPGRRIRRSALELVRRSAAGDLSSALQLGKEHLSLVKDERKQAEAGADYLEKWVGGKMPERHTDPLSILAAARMLDATPDMLRGWERNGLLRVPRDPKNRYRLYGPREIGRLRVIRMLLRSGYSTMSILRAMRHLDAGPGKKLRRVLDTPHPEEEVLSAADRWISTLAEQEERARGILRQLRRMTRIPTSFS